MINQYFGWYSNGGYLPQVVQDIERWFDKFYNKYKKPMLMSEYGASALSGYHGVSSSERFQIYSNDKFQLPGLMYTEDYQTQLISESFKGFDKLRNKGWFIGEMVWNFADFETKQGELR